MLLILILSCCVQLLVYFSFLLDMKSLNQSVITVSYWIPNFGITLNLFTRSSEQTRKHTSELSRKHTKKNTIDDPHVYEFIVLTNNAFMTLLHAYIWINSRCLPSSKVVPKQHGNYTDKYSWTLSELKHVDSQSLSKPWQHEKHVHELQSQMCVYLRHSAPGCVHYSFHKNLSCDPISYLINHDDSSSFQGNPSPCCVPWLHTSCTWGNHLSPLGCCQ